MEVRGAVRKHPLIHPIVSVLLVEVRGPLAETLLQMECIAAYHLQYKEAMECDHKFVYVNDDDCYACMNCALEPNPILRPPFSYEKKKKT